MSRRTPARLCWNAIMQKYGKGKRIKFRRVRERKIGRNGKATDLAPRLGRDELLIPVRKESRMSKAERVRDGEKV